MWVKDAFFVFLSVNPLCFIHDRQSKSAGETDKWSPRCHHSSPSPACCALKGSRGNGGRSPQWQHCETCVCVCYEWEENQPGTRLSLVGAHEGSPFWILTWLMNQSRNDIVPPVKVTFFITPALAGLFTSATSLHATVVALLRFGRDDTLDWLSLKTKTKGKVGNIGLLIDSDLTFSSPVKSITKTAFVQLEIISRRKGRKL